MYRQAFFGGFFLSIVALKSEMFSNSTPTFSVIWLTVEGKSFDNFLDIQ